MRLLVIANPNSIHDRKKLASLTRLGWQCHLLPLGRSTALRNEIPDEIVIHSPLPEFSIRYFFRTLKTAFAVRKLIRANKIDAVLTLYIEPSALWSIFSPLWGIPSVLFAYGTDALKGIPAHFRRQDLLNLLIQQFYRLAFRMSTQLIGTSRTQIESIERCLAPQQLSPTPVLIRTGIDIEKLESRIIRANQIDAPYVLFPRTMAPIYNHEFCLRAISHLPNEIRRKFRFVFVNHDSPLRDYVKLIEREISQTDADILFLNSQSQEEMMNLYQHSSAVVMTPISDGSPVSAMESMFFDKPLILGPLPYDLDLFSPPVYILESWSTTELSSVIVRALAGSLYRQDGVLHTRAKAMCDAKREMRRLHAILHSAVMQGLQDR